VIFPRLIWSALATALVVGSVQTGVQQWQAAPLILAAEVFEEQKTATPEPAEPAEPVQAQGMAASAHEHNHGDAHTHAHAEEHDHDAGAWEPANGPERTAWTWVANTLHAFSMALLMFAVVGLWQYRRAVRGLAAVPAMRVAAWAAAAGWLSFHLWPSLGLPAEVPGMEAAPLQARQMWWVLAVASASGATALLGFARAAWRWPVAVALLAVPFVVGAPHLHGDAIVGYSPEAHAALEQLAQQFVWATAWVSVSFWISLGLAGGWAYQRWVTPALSAALPAVFAAGPGVARPTAH